MSFISCFRQYEDRKYYYWVGMFCLLVGILFLVVLVGGHIVKNQSDVPVIVGGYCAVFATLLSTFQILEHLSCFTNPECQVKIVRILFMVPIYAMFSWLSILSSRASPFLALIRDAYESYAIYAFFQLMICLMGGTDQLYRRLMIEERPPFRHFFPLCCLDDVKVSPHFVQMCRACVFQFMVVKPLNSLAVLILTLTGNMGGIFNVRSGNFWTALVYNISITIAFMALVYFYTGLHPFMEGQRPLSKFLCVKAVIFLSYWQGILIVIFDALHMLPKFNYWSTKDAPEGLQNLLICVEMLFVAFAHKACFGSEEYSAVVYLGTRDQPQNPSDAQQNGNFLFDWANLDRKNGDSPESFFPGLGACNNNVVFVSNGAFVPPEMLSVKNNFKLLMRHDDIRADLRDILNRR